MKYSQKTAPKWRINFKKHVRMTWFFRLVIKKRVNKINT